SDIGGPQRGATELRSPDGYREMRKSKTHRRRIALAIPFHSSWRSPCPSIACARGGCKVSRCYHHLVRTSADRMRTFGVRAPLNAASLKCPGWWTLRVQVDHGPDRLFRRWRTAGQINIQGNDPVKALHTGIGVKTPAAGGTGPHRDAPLRLGHLLPDALH